MKALSKILRITRVIAACSLIVCCWPAMGATFRYTTDFSSDPGWVSDQPAMYYWDGASQNLHVRCENNSPGYTPSRYCYKLLPEPVGSFSLQWDVMPTRIDWSAGIFFGIYDSNLKTAGIPGGQYIQVGPGLDDGGMHWVLYSSPGPTAASPSGTWALGNRYTCNLNYDAATGNIHFEVKNWGSGVPFWSTDITSGPFSNGLKYLGISRGGIGDDGTYPGLNQWAVAEGYLDNVSLSSPANVDSDGDGVPDAIDQCSNTPAGEIVNATGCSISQLVPASWQWRNHGAYVSAVASVADEFMAEGLISGAQKDAIVSTAARSDVGKRRDMSLVAYYPFDGDANDHSGNGNNGILSGTAYVPGRIGSALHFNGSSDTCTVANSPSLNPTTAITVAIWFRESRVGTVYRDRLLEKGATSGGVDTQYYLDIFNQRTLEAFVAVGPKLSAPVPTDGQWHHYALTYDGQHIVLYVDGLQVQSELASGNIPISSDPLTIGYKSMGGETPTDWSLGAVDDVRIYNRALLAPEVENLYALGGVGSTP
jgi:hypothetical protein